MTYREHIAQITRDLGVHIREDFLSRFKWGGKLACLNEWDGCALLEYRAIELLGPVDSPQRYFTALHELGHIHYAHTRSLFEPIDKLVTQEVEATEYALATAIESPSDTLMEEIRHCLRSYVFEPNFNRTDWTDIPFKHSIDKRFPMPSHSIWRLMDESPRAMPAWSSINATITDSSTYTVLGPIKYTDAILKMPG